MTFDWLNTWIVGVVTSGSLFLLWLSWIVERLEGRWSRRWFLPKSRKILLPFEHQIEAWLKYSRVRMTAKQWYGLIVVSLIIFPILGVVMPNVGVMGVITGLYFSGSVVMYPLQKRKTFNLDMERQIQRTKRMLAKLYERNVKPDEMLPILVDALEEGSFKSLVEQALHRTKTTDTLSEAIQWLSDEIQLPSLQSLAAVMVQGSHYANLPLDERLAHMAEKDREKVLINYDKLADGKRIRALLEAASLIALPLMGLTVAFTFTYILDQFSAIKL